MRTLHLFGIVVLACLAYSAHAGTTYGFCNNINFASVNSGAQAELTCNGLDGIFTAGHVITCSPSIRPTTGHFDYYVTGTNQVTIRYSNTGPDAVNPDSTDFVCTTLCPEC